MEPVLPNTSTRSRSVLCGSAVGLLTHSLCRPARRCRIRASNFPTTPKLTPFEPIRDRRHSESHGLNGRTASVPYLTKESKFNDECAGQDGRGGEPRSNYDRGFFWMLEQQTSGSGHQHEYHDCQQNGGTRLDGRNAQS